MDKRGKWQVQIGDAEIADPWSVEIGDASIHPDLADPYAEYDYDPSQLKVDFGPIEYDNVHNPGTVELADPWGEFPEAASMDVNDPAFQVQIGDPEMLGDDEYLVEEGTEDPKRRSWVKR